MSKYIDMLADKYRCHCGTCEVQKGNVSEEECKICSHYAIREALQIADRLEQADVEEAKNIYCQELSCAGLCDECDHLEDFANGYIQALADIRGDTE